MPQIVSDIKRPTLPFIGLAWPLVILILSCSVPCFGLSEEKEYEAAWQLCQAGKYPEAVEAYKKYLSRHPKGKFIPEARFTLARIETSGNNAFGHYQFILDNYPGHPLASQAAYATAQYLQNVGSLAQARERYLYTYSHYGGSPAGRESLAKLALLAMGADSTASGEAYVRAYLDQYPAAAGGAVLLQSLALYWQKKGDEAKAKEYWQKILDVFPGSPESGQARESLIASFSQDVQESDRTEEGSVVVEQPADTVRSEEAVAESIPKGSDPLTFYYLQIGAYGNKGVMDGWARKVKAAGFDTVVEEVKSGKSLVYKLQVGPFETSVELKKAQQSLKSLFGIKAMVVER